MSTMTFRGLLLALALVAAPSAHAQFVQCTEGTGTPISGSVIAIDLASGNVVFPTATVSCGQASVPALSVAITQPGNGASVFIGSSINFQWTIGNFNPATDSCSMSTQPNLAGTSWSLGSVTPSSPAQPFSVSIPAGTTPGNYSFRLQCNRNGTQAASSEVTLNLQAAPQCAGGAPPLPGLNVVQRNWDQLFSTPFGDPGSRLPYPGFPLTSQVTQTSTLIDVLALQIVAPQPQVGVNTFGQLNQNLDNGQPFMFFSKCPGDVSWSQSRQGCSRQGIDINWRLTGFHPTSGRCALDPGETYYFNVAFIQGVQAQNTGVITDICSISGGTYTLNCYWWGGPQLAGQEPVTE